MDLPAVIPHSGFKYKPRNCVCCNEDCKSVTKLFQKINDVRGSWFLIPEDGHGGRVGKAKRECIKRLVGAERMPKGSVIATHHFLPTDLAGQCCYVRKEKDGKHVAMFRWAPRIVGNGNLSVEPKYPLKSSLEDYKDASKAIVSGPTYSEKARATTEEMIVLYRKDKEKLSVREKKRLADFSSTVRRLKRRGIGLAVEKEARLRQVGFDFVGRKKGPENGVNVQRSKVPQKV